MSTVRHRSVPYPSRDLPILRRHIFIVLDVAEAEASGAFLFSCLDEKRETAVLTLLREAHDDLNSLTMDTLLRRLAGELDEDDIPAELSEVDEYYKAIAPRTGEWRTEPKSFWNLRANSVTLIKYGVLE